MHPDAENAKTGEYGLCTDIKVLEHWPRIEEWENPHALRAQPVGGKTVRINCALDDTEDDIKLRLTQKLVQMGDVPLDGHDDHR